MALEDLTPQEFIKKYIAVNRQRVHLMAFIAAFLSITDEKRITCLQDLKKEIINLLNKMIESDVMVNDDIDLKVLEEAESVCKQEMFLELFKKQDKEDDSKS